MPEEIIYDPAELEWSNDATFTHAAMFAPRKRRWFHRLFRLSPRDKLIWSGKLDD